MYYSQDDANKFAFLISKNRESKKGQKNDKTASKRDEQALQEVVDFCTTPGCRRQYVLKHFGEKETDPKKVCMKTCDFCSNPERVEKAIQSSVASRAILFQKKQATKTKKAAKWDGQWDRPHDDDGVYNDWGDEEWNVDGLGITSSSTGDDGGAVASGGGFRTAKSMVDWERLEKLEVRKYCCSLQN